MIQHTEPAVVPVEMSSDDSDAERREAESPERNSDDRVPEKDLPIADPLAALESETVNGSAAGGDGGEVAVNGSAPEGEAVEVAIDPVCGMKVAVTESTLHLDVAGVRVYFCGTGCRLAYAAPPGSRCRQALALGWEQHRAGHRAGAGCGWLRRLGTPKQLLPYESQPLLAHVLGVARRCTFDQLLCVVGGGADEVTARVDFEGVEVVKNPEFGEGCSSSIAAALGAVERDSDLLVLMLGDQPGSAGDRCALLRGIGSAPLAVCGYEDGRGHPIAFARIRRSGGATR